MIPDLPQAGGDCDGLLLSGGRGSRAGGRDKGLLAVGNDSAAATALALLRPLCRRLYVSANRNLDRYRALPQVTVVTDLRPDFPGPLAPLLLMLPNDLPFLHPAVPAALLNHMRAAGPRLDGVFASDGSHPQYLCACLRSHCLGNAGAQLDAGEHRVRSWLDSWSVEALIFSDHRGASLRNCNTAKEWSDLA